MTFWVCSDTPEVGVRFLIGSVGYATINGVTHCQQPPGNYPGSVFPKYATQRSDHLGIVSGICQAINLIEQVDSLVKPGDRKVSCEQGTQALVLNAWGFVGRVLYLTLDYLHNKPVDLPVDPTRSPGAALVDPGSRNPEASQKAGERNAGG